MEPIRKALRSALALSLILTFCLPLGGAMLGVGLGFGLVPVWAIGIALMVTGFYGCPIAWVAYGNKRSLYRLVQAVEEENIYTVRELAAQLGLSEKEVRNRIDTCFNKRYLVGYKKEADGLALNENRACARGNTVPFALPAGQGSIIKRAKRRVAPIAARGLNKKISKKNIFSCTCFIFK